MKKKAIAFNADDLIRSVEQVRDAASCKPDGSVGLAYCRKLAPVIAALMAMGLVPIGDVRPHAGAVEMFQAGTTLPGQNYIDAALNHPAVTGGSLLTGYGRYADGTTTTFNVWKYNDYWGFTFNLQTHPQKGPITALTIGTGLDSNHPDVVSPVLQTYQHPSAGIDLSAIRWADPLPGQNVTFATSMPSNDQTIEMIGRGTFRLAGGPLQDDDGIPRLWKMQFYDLPSGLDPSYYASGRLRLRGRLKSK